MVILIALIFLMPQIFIWDCNTLKNEKKWISLFNGKTLDGWSVPSFEADRTAEIRDGCIIIGRDDLAMGIKYIKPFPKSNYEIIYHAKRTKGHNFFGAITFPVMESFCSFINGGWNGTIFGLSSINDYDASENETTAFYDFKDNQWYQFHLCVCDDRILVWFYPVDEEGNKMDGAKEDTNIINEIMKETEKPKVDLLLENKRISNRIDVEYFQPLGISTWYTEGHIRDIKYRELTPEEIENIRQLPWNARAGME